MLPILAEDLGKIEGAGVKPAGILFHNYVDEKGNTNTKRIVTHGCIWGGPFHQYTNIRCVEA